MTEDRIRQAFAFAAGDAAPPPDLYDRIALELKSRPARRPVWRGAATAAAGMILAVGLTVAAVPGARAAVQGLVVTLAHVAYQGQAGEAKVLLRWTDPESTQKLWESGEIKRFDPAPVADLAAAAKQVGFDPVVLPTDAGNPVSVMAGVGEQGASQARVVALEYTLGSQIYQLATEGTYHRQNDGWQAAERKEIGWLSIGIKPRDAEVLPLGKTQALCYGYSDQYVCQWLQDGRQVTLMGPDRQGVLDLVKEIAR